MEQPTVKVTDISNLLGEDLPLNNQVDLGDPEADARVNSLLERRRDGANHAYILRWEGSKVPRGAIVGDETLAWTQNGTAHNRSGRMVGTYDRVVVFGGESGQEQAMIVYTS